MSLAKTLAKKGEIFRKGVLMVQPKGPIKVSIESNLLKLLIMKLLLSFRAVSEKELRSYLFVVSYITFLLLP